MKLRFKKILCILVSAAFCVHFYPVYAAEDMRVSQECIELIKAAEGFSRYKYWDYSQWTIGYGTGVSADEYPDGITEAEAEQLLYNAVVRYEGYVNNFADRYDVSLKQNQFDALVSLTYNMGNIWSAYDTFDLKTYVINGSENYSFLDIAKGFGEWRVAGGSVIQGLVTRRQEETKLFLSDREDYSGEVWRVNSEDGTNLRREPDVNSERIGFMKMNTIFYVTEKKTTGDGYLWGKVSYEGEECWCVLDFSKYIVGGPIECFENGDEVSGEKWIITSEDGVRLRSGPGLNYENLAIIPKDKEIIVTSTAEADGYLWGKTKFAGSEGWCALDFAERKDNQDTELPGRTLESIYISSMPNKLTYTEGEMFDPEGICVKAVYSDGSEEVIPDFTLDGFESAPGTHTINVTYMNKTASFEVEVIQKQLTGIEIAKLPDKTVYSQGEQLDISGIKVNALFNNGTTEEIQDFSVSGYNHFIGEKKIVIEYQGFTADFNVEVIEKKLTAFEITKLPDKLEYYKGEQFSTKGMIVYAYYDNHSKNVITYYTVSGFDSQIIGDQIIRISYNGFIQTFIVSVKEHKERPLTGDIDGDGKRTIFDLILLNQYAENGHNDLEYDKFCAADINGDKIINDLDVEILTYMISQE